MKKLKFLPLIALLLFVSASCNKQKQLEKTLFKKNGTWNINTFTYTGYEDNVLYYNETFSNAGTFVFAENGTGTATFTIDGDTDVNAFTWTNTEDKITIVIDGDAIIFDVKDQSKSTMELENTDSYTDMGISYRDVTNMKLEKK